MFAKLGVLLLIAFAISACSDFGQQPAPTAKVMNVSIVNNHASDGIFFEIKVDQEVTIVAPFDGTVHVKYFKNGYGESFPQIDLVSGNDSSLLSLMLGKVGEDVLVIANDGQAVRRGAPLAKLVGLGPSVALYLPRWGALLTKGGSPQIFGWWIDASGNFIELKNTLDLFDRI